MFYEEIYLEGFHIHACKLCSNQSHFMKICTILLQGGELAEVMSNICISPSGHVVKAASDPARQFAWEQGEIDYLGVDKFDNIKMKLDQAMSGPPPPPVEQTSSPFNL